MAILASNVNREVFLYIQQVRDERAGARCHVGDALCGPSMFHSNRVTSLILRWYTVMVRKCTRLPRAWSGTMITGLCYHIVQAVARWYKVDYLPVLVCFFLEVAFVTLFQCLLGPILNTEDQQSFGRWSGESSVKENEMGVSLEAEAKRLSNIVLNILVLATSYPCGVLTLSVVR